MFWYTRIATWMYTCPQWWGYNQSRWRQYRMHRSWYHFMMPLLISLFVYMYHSFHYYHIFSIINYELGRYCCRSHLTLIISGPKSESTFPKSVFFWDTFASLLHFCLRVRFFDLLFHRFWPPFGTVLGAKSVTKHVKKRSRIKTQKRQTCDR